MKQQRTEIVEVKSNAFAVEIRFMPEGAEYEQQSYTVRVVPKRDGVFLSVSGLQSHPDRDQVLKPTELYANQVTIAFESQKR